MRINAFYHLNNISGTSYRPDWLSLAKFGDRKAIADFLAAGGIERIVLLEDFVGSGDFVGRSSPVLLFCGEVQPHSRAIRLPGAPGVGKRLVTSRWV